MYSAPYHPKPVDIERYLKEDIGSGDLTALIIPELTVAKATVISRESMTLCGQEWFTRVFQYLDPVIDVIWHFSDGDEVEAGQEVCSVQGPARALMTGERTALNLLQTLSGTATLSRRYSKETAGTHVKILDTRKTIPGLRDAQKYAVRCGGCYNHRIGLYDGILIKENHILAAGSIRKAVHAALCLDTHLVIEIEVETLSELEEALEAGVKRILLDEFSLEMMKQAVLLNQKRAELEVSGSVSLNQIRMIAETGVDYISIGALTKNVRAIDLSMRVILGT